MNVSDTKHFTYSQSDILGHYGDEHIVILIAHLTKLLIINRCNIGSALQMDDKGASVFHWSKGALLSKCNAEFVSFIKQSDEQCFTFS